MSYNDENMLMIDLEEVDEQVWDDAMMSAFQETMSEDADNIEDVEDASYIEDYESMMGAMQEPEIDVSGNASSRQEKLIRDINWVLNGCSHKLDHVVFIKCIDGGEMQCEKVLYRDGKLWAQEYDFDHDWWEQQNLVGVCEDSLEELYKILIEEIF